MAEPAAQRRQITMQAGRLAPGTALAAEPVADQMRADLFDACDMRGRAIAGEMTEIAARGRANGRAPCREVAGQLAYVWVGARHITTKILYHILRVIVCQY